MPNSETPTLLARVRKKRSMGSSLGIGSRWAKACRPTDKTNPATSIAASWRATSSVVRGQKIVAGGARA